jgi:hypothetical protein
MQAYKDSVLTRSGDAVSGATVNVYLAGTVTFATIYADNNKTSKDNPITTDADGEFEFYAENGKYDLYTVYSGSTDTKPISLHDSEYVLTKQYTTDIATDVFTPSSYKSAYYDSNKVSGSGAEWVWTGAGNKNVGLAGTGLHTDGYVYNWNGDQYDINGDVTLLKYGSIGDDSTDNSTAISKAVKRAFVATDKKSLYVDPGIHLTSGHISENITTADTGIVLYGASYATSIIKGSNLSGIFAFTADSDTPFIVRNIGFEPSGVDKGTAFDITYTGTAQNFKSIEIENSYFGAQSKTDAQTNYFTKGISTGHTTSPVGSGSIKGCYFQGRNETVPSKMTAIELKYANDIVIDDCKIYNCLYGVFTDTYETEGLSINQTYMVRVKTGVYYHIGVTGPYFTLANSHIAYSLTGIDTKNVNQGFIHDALLYTRDDTTEATTTDILIDTGNLWHIYHNTTGFENATVTTQRGIVFNGACTGSLVEHNTIGERKAGITLQHATTNYTTNSNFTHNKFINVITGGQEFVVSDPSHSDNYFGGTPDEYITTCTVASNQTITTATWTTVNYASPAGNYDALLLDTTATPGEFAVPNGIRRLKFKVSGKLDGASAAAFIGVRVMKDTGGGFAEVAQESLVIANPCIFSAETKELNFDGGDLVRIELYQNSGASGTLQSSSVYTSLITYIV